MKKQIFRYLFLLLAILSFSVTKAQDIPARPEPPKLVNDLAGLLSPEQAEQLEQALVIFNDSTSTQITVVTVKSLNGYDKLDFAQRLGQAWGVGQKGKNNGVVVLIKPKIGNEKGEAAIQTGYGMEGILPDITCKRIVDNEMIPRFREGDYFGGIGAGVSTIMEITKGEYTADVYNKKHKESPYGIFIPIIIIIILVFWIRSGRNRSRSVGKSLPFWTSLFLLGSMGNHNRGGWGGFSGGSGFGGGGGGFGGFGGGSFGGGGAGGSW